MNYQRGEIVWVKFPFTDGSPGIIRPGLVISNNTINKTGEYLLMQLTTRVRYDDFSMIITDKDYTGKPLNREGQLRLHKVFILNQALITGSITHVSHDFMKKITARFLTLIT